MDFTDVLRLLVALSCCVQVLRSQEDVTEPWDMDGFNKEASQTFNLVFHKYNNRVRPPQEFVEVNMTVTLNHIKYLDVRRQELQTVLDVDMEWYDSRLTWEADIIKVISVNTSKIWVPDIVYTNGVAPTKSLFPLKVRIKNDGMVLWTKKEIVTTYCNTDAAEPSQKCKIGYGYLSMMNTHSDHIDRFFDNTSSVILPSSFANNEWGVVDVDMILGGDNVTKPSTLDIELTLEPLGTSSSSSSSANGELTSATYVVGSSSANKGCGCDGNGSASRAAGVLPFVLSLSSVGLVMSLLLKEEIFLR